LPSNVLSAIWEVALNIKLGNVKLTADQAAFFSKRKKILRKISSKSTSLAAKRKLLTPALLKSLLVPVLEILKHGYQNEAGS
jgi:hypothetical protein